MNQQHVTKKNMNEQLVCVPDIAAKKKKYSNITIDVLHGSCKSSTYNRKPFYEQ